MVGVGEYQLEAEPFEVFRANRLDGRLGSDWHEGGRLHGSVRRAQAPTPCLGMGADSDQFEGDRGRVRSFQASSPR